MRDSRLPEGALSRFRSTFKELNFAAESYQDSSVTRRFNAVGYDGQAFHLPASLFMGVLFTQLHRSGPGEFRNLDFLFKREALFL